MSREVDISIYELFDAKVEFNLKLLGVASYIKMIIANCDEDQIIEGYVEFDEPLTSEQLALALHGNKCDLSMYEYTAEEMFGIDVFAEMYLIDNFTLGFSNDPVDF